MTTDLANLQIQRQVSKLWLQGYGLADIQVMTGLKSRNQVTQVLDGVRDDLRALNAKLIDERIEEAVEELRMVKVSAWQGIEAGQSRHRLLAIIIRAIQTQSQIRGLITKNVVHSGEISHKKLYEFTNTYPLPDGTVIEGEALEPAQGLLDIQPPEDLDDAVNQLPEYTPEQLEANAKASLVTEFEANDGSIIELPTDGLKKTQYLPEFPDSWTSKQMEKR